MKTVGKFRAARCRVGPYYHLPNGPRVRVLLKGSVTFVLKHHLQRYRLNVIWFSHRVEKHQYELVSEGIANSEYQILSSSQYDERRRELSRKPRQRPCTSPRRQTHPGGASSY